MNEQPAAPLRTRRQRRVEHRLHDPRERTEKLRRTRRARLRPPSCRQKTLRLRPPLVSVRGNQPHRSRTTTAGPTAQICRPPTPVGKPAPQCDAIRQAHATGPPAASPRRTIECCGTTEKCFPHFPVAADDVARLPPIGGRIVSFAVDADGLPVSDRAAKFSATADPHAPTMPIHPQPRSS